MNIQSIQGIHMASGAYAGADLAGVSRIQYPSNVRLIRLMCTGRVNHGFLLKAFLKGADGLLVSG
jgi:F420-non-reducing hydrogenase iron-sulfur subunit